jgi:hypothetical protein
MIFLNPNEAAAVFLAALGRLTLPVVRWLA